MAIEVQMPQMGESVVEGTIAKWLVKEGDMVTEDQPLVEISTDKVDTEIPSPSAGTIAKLVAEEGQTLPVGAVIALIEKAGAGVQQAKPAAPPSAPAAPEPSRAPQVRVMADEHMLAQALTNVLKNATEAVGARRAGGGGASFGKKEGGRIRARLVSDDAGVAFEVEDNGIGLPAKDCDRLTEPYVTTREKGTGLGLAIVKRILEDHGGDLELTDAPSGRGALAILRLPASARVSPAAKTQSVTA